MQKLVDPVSVAHQISPATIELALPPDAAERLHRLPPLAKLGAGAGRRTELELVWHDTPAGDLAADGLSLCERRLGRARSWRLERLIGTPEAPWPPGTPAPLLAEAETLEALAAGRSAPLPAPLLPIAACSGSLRTLRLAEPGLSVSLLTGQFRAVAGERPVARLLLAGPPALVASLALDLADAAPVSVPATSLAAEAAAVAGRATAPRALGAPLLSAELSVSDAFAAIIGHLTLVLLHWAPHAGSGATPEPVHQMRVALRRLRSALKLFRAAVGGADLAAVGAELRALSQMLGPARDWDVFCAGTGRAVAAQFPEERSVARLLTAAERQRQASYATLSAHLAGPAFRRLGLRLACLAALRPWDSASSDENTPDPAMARQANLRMAPLAEFAARALSQRAGHLSTPEKNFAETPSENLHELRIQAKRMRYAIEFFEPLFAKKETRRFLRRIGALQERLGHLNDGAVAATLLSALGGGGAERAMAVGIVRGYVAAHAGDARARSERTWRKLRRLEPFWD